MKNHPNALRTLKASKPPLTSDRWCFRFLRPQVDQFNPVVQKQNETLALAKKFNTDIISIDKIKKKFDAFDVDGSGTIDFDEFYEMLKSLGLRPVCFATTNRLTSWKVCWIVIIPNGVMREPQIRHW